MNAMERLNQLVKEKGPLLAGLDPDYNKVRSLYEAITKETFNEEVESEADYLDRIICKYCYKYLESVKDYVIGVKINSAVFEEHGWDRTFWDIMWKAKEYGLFVIADVKRGDVYQASRRYADAFLWKTFPVDAVTVNPYIGTDSVKPFIEVAEQNEKAVFVLVKTANESASDIQDIVSDDGKKVYQKVGDLVKKWGESTKNKEKYSVVGAIVGSTNSGEVKQLRQQLPNTFFLISREGSRDERINIEDLCEGSIINSSELMYAYEHSKYPLEDWAKATSELAATLQKELIKVM